MLRFTIRDLLWLMVVVALGVALWLNRSQHRVDMDKVAEEARQLKRESKTWETRAQALRDDMMTGTNKNTDVEFIPNGIRYVPKQSPSVGIQKSPHDNN